VPDATASLLPVPPASPIRSAGPKASALVFGHEMKNYLCAIRGNARLLRMASQDKEQAAIIDRIDQVIARMESMEWKDGAAPEMIASTAKETVDLHAVAKACSRLHFAGSKADFRFEADAPALIEGDAGRMEQVFQNLYGNALEAGAASLITRFRRAGNGLEVTVEDDGRGCAREALRRIFEPFYSTKRSCAAPEDRKGGAARGLGLFIVQSIVESHKGRVHAAPRNDRGDGSTGPATGLVIHLHFPLPVPAASSTPTLLREGLQEAVLPPESPALQTFGVW
jgi:signal transduction histidine kinase